VVQSIGTRVAVERVVGSCRHRGLEYCWFSYPFFWKKDKWIGNRDFNAGESQSKLER